MLFTVSTDKIYESGVEHAGTRDNITSFMRWILSILKLGNWKIEPSHVPIKKSIQKLHF